MSCRKKVRSIAAVALIIAGMTVASAPVMAMGERPTPEQQERLDEIMRQAKAERCPDGSKIIVEINGVKIAVPRIGTGIELQDGRYLMDIDKSQKYFSCQDSYIPNAIHVRMNRFSIEKYDAKNLITFYKQIEKDIKIARAENRIESLSSGIQKFVHPSKQWEFYILPSEKARTENREPVVLRCTPKEKGSVRFDNCQTGYQITPNLMLAYTYLRKDYDQDDFIAADQDMRRKFEEMVEEAKKMAVENERNR